MSAFGQQCHNCGKQNHFKSQCRSTKSSRPNRQINQLYAETNSSSESDDTFHSPLKALYDDGKKIDKEGHCSVTVNDKQLNLKVDTGAKCNVMSLNTYKLVRHNEELQMPIKQVNLVAFAGSMIKPIGTVTLPCKLHEQLYNLQFEVVKESVHSILGLQDSLHMKLVAFSREVFNLDCVKDHTLSQKMFKAYADLFKDEVGDLPVTYSMKVDPEMRDDIIIDGKDPDEHERNLKKVLDRARQVKLRLNPSKCKFGLNEVSYVGHAFTDKRLKANPKKKKAISEIPPPEDKPALQRFLGMVNYLEFIPNLSELTTPLRQLLHKVVVWNWTEHQQNAFDRLKTCISSPPVLHYYDVRQPVTLTCDASQYGLGAACLQEENPMAYASCTLTQTETRYAQIGK